MQVDIKTTSVTQLRHTFSNVARRLGGDRPASRYQEATFDLQPEVNFHYRPLWDPRHELYDKNRTRIVMRDWYAFTDPRQYYYGTYTIARSRQQETMEKNTAFVETRGLLRTLPAEAHASLTERLLPLRHVEWAANMNNCQITALGWGTAITQATMYHTMDRLGIAQYLSRIGLLLDGNSGDSLAGAKRVWMEEADWQELRRYVENSLVIEDWFELFVAQNFVLDGLLYPLAYQHFDARFGAEYGPTLSMLTNFMSSWFDETRRWVDATLKVAAAESEHNAALLGEWVARWTQAAVEALKPLAPRILGGDGAAILETLVAELRVRSEKIGVRA
ncbi:aromatic/alkene monooxygenase hydroxylase subunit beta [Solimonas soli]|uniref:aromatic/alkene monooxygenase hydroxylase subunit beta n=1 Tax=Solimonas soli TaxID=413479 RepID=UPI00048271FC|nr:aromatic/alkene monooxygenase hydroxylase subunit beta [Solimonas soli]